MFDKIYEELKAVPVTMILLVILYLAVLELYKDRVGRSEFLSLRDQIVGVQYTLRTGHLDSRLHQVQSELFTLGTSVKEKAAKGIAVDDYILQRITDLTNEEASLKSRIADSERLENERERIQSQQR